MKGDLEAIGEEYDDILPVSKIQTQIYNLTKGTVNLMDDLDPTKFKSTYQIIEGISKVWSQISETDQAQLLEIVAGKQRGNQAAALIQSFQSGQTQKALEASINSANSALDEQAKYMESIQYSADRLKGSFQELAADTLNSDWVKGFYDISNALIQVIDKIGLFNIAIVALAGVVGAKTTLGMTAFQGVIEKLIIKMGVGTAAAETMGMALSTMIPAALIVGGITAIAVAYDHFNVTLEEARENTQKLQSEYDSMQQDLSATGDELSKITERINELNSKETLTFVEKDELDKLRETNSQLETQISLLRKQNDLKNEELNKAIKEEFSKQYGEDSNVQKTISEAGMAWYNRSQYVGTEEGYVKYQIERFQELNKIKDKGLELTKDELKEYEKISKYLTNVGVDYADFASRYTIDDSTRDSWIEMSAIINKMLNPEDFKANIFDKYFNDKDFESTKNKLIELSQGGKLDPSVIANGKEYQKFLYDTGLTATEVADQINASYKIIESSEKSVAAESDDLKNSIGETISSLDALNKAFSSLDSAYSNLSSKTAVSIEDITSLNETFGDTAGFDDFIKTISSANSLTSDVQDAFNSLSGTYLLTSGILDGLNQENKDLLVTQLQHIGISNAEEIVTSKLAEQKSILAETGLDVKKATADEIVELINEGNVSEDTRIALTNLAAQKLNVNNVALSTSGDIANLLSLMSLTNSTTEALQALQMAKEGKVPMSIARPGDLESIYSRAQAEVDAYYKGLGNYQNTTYTGGSKTASTKNKKTKSSKNEYFQELDQIARSVDLAEKAVTKLNNALDEDASYKKQIENIQKLIEGQKTLEATYKSAAKAYKVEYNSSISGLDPKYIKQIQSGGTFSIQDFKGESGEKLYNQITTAQKYWDSYQDSLQKANDTTKDIVENTSKIKELKVDEILEPFAKKSTRQSGILEDVDQSLNFVDNGSIEQLQLLQTGYFTAQKSVENLNKEITALNKAYKNNKSDENYKTRLADLESQLNDSSSAMKSYQDEIISAMKERYDEQKKLIEDAYDEQLDKAEEAHKFNLDILDKELDAYKKIIEAQQESLDKEKEKYFYEKDIANKTKDISNIQERILELQKAADSGDRSAQSELSKLQEDLADKQEELTDTQYEHRIDQEKDALDKAYAEYEDLVDARIEKENQEYENYKKNAKDLNDLKLKGIKDVYESEKALIIEAANLTSSEFSKVFESINSTLSEYGLSMSSGLASTLKATNNASSKKSAISGIIGSGGEVTKVYSANSGASDLNKYLASKGYNILDESGMARLATILELSDIGSKTDLTNADKNKILSALIAAGFDGGGIARTRSNSIVNTLTGGKEDGLALVRNGEGFVAPEHVGSIKSLLNNLEPLKHIVRLTGLDLNATKANSAMAITIGNLVEVSGTIDNNTVGKVQTAAEDALSKLSDLIRTK